MANTRDREPEQNTQAPNTLSRRSFLGRLGRLIGGGLVVAGVLPGTLPDAAIAASNSSETSPSPNKRISRVPLWVDVPEQHKHELNQAHRVFVDMLNQMYRLDYPPFDEAIEWYLANQGIDKGQPRASKINGMPVILQQQFIPANDEKIFRGAQVSEDVLIAASVGKYRYGDEERFGVNLWYSNRNSDKEKYSPVRTDRIMEFYGAVVAIQEIMRSLEQSEIDNIEAARELYRKGAFIPRTNSRLKELTDDIKRNNREESWGFVKGVAQTPEQTETESAQQGAMLPNGPNEEPAPQED